MHVTMMHVTRMALDMEGMHARYDDARYPDGVRHGRYVCTLRTRMALDMEGMYARYDDARYLQVTEHDYIQARANAYIHACIHTYVYICIHRSEDQKRPGITNSVATHLFSDNIVTAAPGFNAGMGRHIRAQQYSDWRRNWQSVRTRNEKGEQIHVG